MTKTQLAFAALAVILMALACGWLGLQLHGCVVDTITPQGPRTVRVC